jgi:predicted CopG family antitoxin
MLSKPSKPSKSEMIRSLQGTKESDLSIFEPVTQDSLKKVSEEVSKIVRSSGFVSIIVVKHS